MNAEEIRQLTGDNHWAEMDDGIYYVNDEGVATTKWDPENNPEQAKLLEGGS